MARDGSGIYSFPPGGNAISGQAGDSSAFNTRFADLLADLNAARPINAGGTAATNAADARSNLGVQASDALLIALAALDTSSGSGKFIKITGTDTISVFDLFGTANDWTLGQSTTVGALGSTGGDEKVVHTFNVPDGNATKLIVRALRRSNGSSHDTSAGEIRRRVDASDQDFVRWTSSGLVIGYDATEHILIKPTGEIILYEVGSTSPLGPGYRGLGPANIQNTTFTFQLTDAGKAVDHSSSSAHTWTVPPNSSIAMPENTVLLGHNFGAGVLTLARGAGVAILDESGANADLTVDQHKNYYLRRHPTVADIWIGRVG